MILERDRERGREGEGGLTCFRARFPMIRFHFSMGESIFPTFTCVRRDSEVRRLGGQEVRRDIPGEHEPLPAAHGGQIIRHFGS